MRHLTQRETTPLRQNSIVYFFVTNKICNLAITITKICVTKKCVIWKILSNSDILSDKILDYTNCHPYYSKQLASVVWQTGILQPDVEDPFVEAIEHIVMSHGLDYERLWMNLNRTNKWILQRLASGQPLQTGYYPTSTVYSALKRLQKDGYVIYSDRYEIEDPFYRQWIRKGV